jgi:hypothetical protein
MDCPEWDGQHLGDERMALALMLGRQMPGEAEPRVVFAAAATGDFRCLIRPERLGEFLQVHRDLVLICHAAGPFHEGLREHLRRAGQTAAMGVLRRFRVDRRIYEVSLLDQLVGLAKAGLERPVRPLKVLAQEHCGIDLPDLPTLRSRLEGLTGQPWESIDQSSREDALAIVHAIRAIFGVVGVEATRIAEQAGVDPEVVATLGPLSVGIQVQGDIALYRLGRRGLLLRKDTLDTVRELSKARFLECSGRLHADSSAKGCFRWKTGGPAAEVALDESGRPAAKKQVLRQWLAAKLASTPGLHGIPFRPPSSVEDRISTSPGLWGELALIDPLLRAWSGLVSAADAMRSLGGLGKVGDRLLRPSYEVLPRATSTGPNLEQLRRLNSSAMSPSAMFEAPPSYALLVVELRDLELRCLAEICERSGMESKLAELFRAGEDPIRYTAAALYSDALFLRDDPHWKEGLDALNQQNPLRYGQWLHLARTFLQGAARSLAHEHIRDLLHQDLGEQLTLVNVVRAYGLVVGIIPELESYLSDQTVNRVRGALGIDFMEMPLLLESVTYPGEFSVHLRDLLAGRCEDNALLALLSELNTDPVWRERLAKGRGDLDVYKDIFLKEIVTGTGRVRGGMESHQADAAAYLDLADDVRKVVLDAIEAPGLNPVALAGDEIVLLVPEQAMKAAGAIEAATEEIRSLVEGAAREFLDAIPIVCEVRKAAAW